MVIPLKRVRGGIRVNLQNRCTEITSETDVNYGKIWVYSHSARALECHSPINQNLIPFISAVFQDDSTVPEYEATAQRSGAGHTGAVRISKTEALQFLEQIHLNLAFVSFFLKFIFRPFPFGNQFVLKQGKGVGQA